MLTGCKKKERTEAGRECGAECTAQDRLVHARSLLLLLEEILEQASCLIYTAEYVSDQECGRKETEQTSKEKSTLHRTG